MCVLLLECVFIQFDFIWLLFALNDSVIRTVERLLSPCVTFHSAKVLFVGRDLSEIMLNKVESVDAQ